MFGFPTASPAARLAEHRFVYATGADPPVEDWPRRPVKIDARGDTVAYDADGYATEPVFVPEPDGAAEGDGVVLCVSLDADAGRSVLPVVDARSMTELARLPLGHVVPFGFHGRFFPAD